jgi:hypothetical protein
MLERGIKPRRDEAHNDYFRPLVDLRLSSKSASQAITEDPTPKNGEGQESKGGEQEGEIGGEEAETREKRREKGQGKKCKG